MIPGMPMSLTANALPLPAGPNETTAGPLVREAEKLWPTLSHLEGTYPGFTSWYWNKVMPGLSRGTRHLLWEGSLDAPSAVAILKREGGESKICTAWVAESERKRNLGRRMLEESIDWLGEARPLFTVPAERYAEFEPLMRRLGFVETARIESLYRPGVVEHVFNGSLAPSLNT
ncbi:hypothetical protein MEX01_54130 [Methylorubrum extorquens]|nr:hypothetical protein MEX01_54130 [Methylorubrum extorquens]